MPEEIKADRRGFYRILKMLDDMLRDDVRDYIETESKRKGDIKVEHALRIRFLDDDNSG